MMGGPSLLKSETFGFDTVHGNVGSVMVKRQISVRKGTETQSGDIIAHLELCMQFWSPSFQREMKDLKKFQRRTRR